MSAPSEVAVEATKAEAPEVTEVTQGLGGRRVTGEDATPTASSPSSTGSDRYARGTEKLCEKVLEARKQVGRPTLAAFLGETESAVWRWERNKVHPGEVDKVKAAVARFGDLPDAKPKGRASRTTEALALLDKAEADRQFGKSKLIEELRAILSPPEA